MGVSGGAVWITGASSGIGKAVVHRLAHEGYSVVATARRTHRLRQLARLSEHIYALPCDCTDPDAVAGTAEELLHRFGTIRALIHCVGAAVFKPLGQTSLEEVENLFRANVQALFLCLQAVLPAMVRQSSGVIIHISSVAALKAFPSSSVYGAFKAAAAHMLRALREEVRSAGIAIVNLHVGATATPLWQPSLRRRWSYRMLQPEDVAETVCALLRLAERPRLLPEELVLRPQLGDLP